MAVFTAVSTAVFASAANSGISMAEDRQEGGGTLKPAPCFFLNFEPPGADYSAKRAVPYKSNKRAREEYLANEAKNRERNRQDYQRRKARGASGRGGVWKIIVLLVAGFLLIQYFNHRGAAQRAVFVSAPSR